MAIYDERQKQYQNLNEEGSRELVAVNRAVSAATIKIKIGNIAIGYIQTYNETQARDATPLYEVGTVGIIEHQPGQPKYTLTIDKLAVYRINFLKIAMQAGMNSSNKTLYDAIKSRLPNNDPTIDFSTIVENAIPFDIVVEETDPVNNASILNTTWVDCIITNYTRKINATGNLTITETVNLSARKPRASAQNLSIVYPPTA